MTLDHHDHRGSAHAGARGAAALRRELADAPSPTDDRPVADHRRGPVRGRAPPTATGSSAAVAAAREAFDAWRAVPAPVRGALVKRSGELLTEHKGDVADLITIEVGKIRSEALGEAQEMIDICDFAVGLSRQLDGRTMPSERPGHRLMETWHPLGVVGVISAFNFPAAVWSWNTAVALVCGDTVVWKPSRSGRADGDGVPTRCSTGRPPSSARPRDLNVSCVADAERGQALVDEPGRRAGQRDRLGADGREVAPAGRRALRPRAARARRQQRRDRRAVGRSRARRARDLVRRRRHRGPALHDAAPADRARGRRRRARRAARRASIGRCRSATRSTTARSSAR